MTGQEANTLIEVGATDRLRKKLKRMAIPERLSALQNCMPIVNTSNRNLRFFRDNFSVELGAILECQGDLQKATEMVRNSID